MTAALVPRGRVRSAAEVTDRQIAQYEQLLVNQEELCQ